MVDAARQALDELMGRNRNLDPSAKMRKVNWDDPEFCQYYLVKFCPHDLFVNTRADLGPCPKLHDDEAKEMFETARYGARKRQFEDDFLRFCNTMLNEVDRKIQKGKQRLLLMNKNDNSHGSAQAPVLYVSKFQEQINNINARIKKLLNEAEEAGHRGDVDQAQGLMTLCEQLKEEKDTLIAQHENAAASPKTGSIAGTSSTSPERPLPSASVSPGLVAATAPAPKVPTWMTDLNGVPEKQMEVCEICGAFLIVGDAQQRIEDHLMGKQHLGYSKLRKAVQELHEKRQKDREEEEKRRDEERRLRGDNGYDRNRRDRDNIRDRGHDYNRGRYSRDDRSYGKDRYSDRRERDYRRSRHESKSYRKSRSRSPRKSRSRSHSRK